MGGNDFSIYIIFFIEKRGSTSPWCFCVRFGAESTSGSTTRLLRELTHTHTEHPPTQGRRQLHQMELNLSLFCILSLSLSHSVVCEKKERPNPLIL